MYSLCIDVRTYVYHLREQRFQMELKFKISSKPDSSIYVYAMKNRYGWNVISMSMVTLMSILGHEHPSFSIPSLQYSCFFHIHDTIFTQEANIILYL